MNAQVPLTRHQLRQLVSEYEALRDWTIVNDFCEQAYGPGKVARFETETYGEYNDEGSTDYRIENIFTFDLNNEYVGFDFSLPFWQEILKGNPFEGNEDEQVEDVIQVLREWWPQEETNWVQWDELPCNIHVAENKVYDLRQRPTVSWFQVPASAPAQAVDRARHLASEHGWHSK